MIKTLLIAGAFCLAGGAVGATTLDFDTAVGDLAGVDLGEVTITAGGSPVSAASTPNGTTGLLAYDFNCGCFPNAFTATFETAMTDVSVDLGDFNQDADDLYLYAYDAANVLVDSFLISIDAAFIGLETLTVSATSISYVVFGGVGLNGENNVYADNLTFSGNVAAVPVPAAGLLLIGGLGLLGAVQGRPRA